MIKRIWQNKNQKKRTSHKKKREATIAFEDARKSATWIRIQERSSLRQDDFLISAQNVSSFGHPCFSIYDGNSPSWSPHLRTLLCGTRDKMSPLHLLRGKEGSIIVLIYDILIATWSRHIHLKPPAYLVHRGEVYIYGNECLACHHDTSIAKRPFETPVANSLVGKVEFPKLGVDFRDVYMLPFVLGDIGSLPKNLWPYYDTIITACPVKRDGIGRVVYLTVKEGLVECGDTLPLFVKNRRGINIESGEGELCSRESFTPAVENSYAEFDDFEVDKYDGGLFMSSNVADSFVVWDALIDVKAGLVGQGGNVDHVKNHLKSNMKNFGASTKIGANELVWMTTRTPRKAMPVKEDSYFQIFCLVTTKISTWNSNLSTPNPKVPLPHNVKVV